MTLDQDDSPYVQALREDLPSAEEEARMRRRFLVAGLAAASVTSASGASAASTSWGATLVAKVTGLSWPATLVLAAAVATPVAALPVWLSPASPPARKVQAIAARPPSLQQRVPISRGEILLPLPVSAPSAEPAPPAGPAALPKNESITRRIVQRSASSAPLVQPAPIPTPTPKPNQSPSATPIGVSALAASEDPQPRPPAALTMESASTLAAETQLLERAFTELAAGHESAAAALISQHERQYPNGLLRRERERARARLNQSPKGE